tara:strand:- start:446 stop:739 length:294 start_codon:yes stop_codon:yes gene_type:complete
MSNNLINASVYDKASALDLIFGFLQLAQSRGSYSLQESSKIFECMKQFKDFFQQEEETKEEEPSDEPKEELNGRGIVEEEGEIPIGLNNPHILLKAI